MIHLFAILVAAACSFGTGADPQLTHGPILGDVTATSARVWVRLSGPGEFVVHLDPEGDASTEGASVNVSSRPSSDGCAVAHFRSLRPGVRYRSRVTTASGEPLANHKPVEFQTDLAEPTAIRLIFGSCAAGTLKASFIDRHGKTHFELEPL